MSSNVKPRVASLSSWLSPFGRPQLKPARLFLTPNQLYYLLSRFDELGVNTGPTNIRLENLHAAPSSSSNYVSFLAQAQQPKIRSYDADSIHSVTSVRSLVSSMSHALSNMSFSAPSAAKIAKQEAVAKEDVRYLYSCFTKIPCLKLSIDHRLRPITSFEEFPFDTAVPVTIFKNLTAFEVADIDFRSVFGWDFLADNLQSLTIKRACLDNLCEVLNDVVLDDMDQRRRRSSKATQPSGLPLATPSHISKFPPFLGSISPSMSSPQFIRPRSSDGTEAGQAAEKQGKKLSRSISPKKSSLGRKSSLYSRPQNQDRRSSTSSTSSARLYSPRQSSTSLLLHMTLPSHKWRFLRHLSVPDNGLTAISADSLVPLTDSLQSLDLSSNLLTEVPESLSALVALRALNLSNCLVDSIRSLGRHPLPAITVLNLKGNKLDSLAGIENLKSLQRLDVRENRLTDPAEAARLTCMPNFSEVYLKHNPFTRTHAKHRITTFNLFRAAPGYAEDIIIDGTGPQRSERRYLADRVPEVSRDVIAEFVDTEDLTAALSVNAPENQTVENTVASNEPQTPNPPAKQRAKGPKRRVVEIVDSPTTSASEIDRQARDTSVFMTAPENPHTQIRAQYKDTQASLIDQEYGDTVASPVQTRVTNNLANAEISGFIQEEASTNVSRPDFLRDVSQSNAAYQNRIEALKNDQTDTWLRTIGAHNLTPEESLDPIIAAHAPSGILTPHHATNRTPVNI